MLPYLEFPPNPHWNIPSEAECVALWDKYEVLPNIRAHSTVVAEVAVGIVERVIKKGLAPKNRLFDVPSARAAGLLHDLAKTYTIYHGGSHAQLGASWVLEETGNPIIAQAVYHHVRSPWDHASERDGKDPLRLTVILSYSDKRVMHDKFVSLDERFDDLIVRYGISDDKKKYIYAQLDNVKRIEESLFKLIGEI